MLGRRHVYKLSRLILTKLSKTLFETNYKIGQFTSIHYLAQVLQKIIKGIMRVVQKN
jgi:hypothetical protein